MSLAAGTKLGVYEIAAPLGAGGMGEVYRARDTRLGREVAIKILPDAVAADAERIARFEREAKALAALNHPNIATLFGMEQVEGRHVLVMELVEGQTLENYLRAKGANRASGAKGTEGGLAIDELMAIATQIAEALEAAHERGIVHRDLKPANIKVTGDPPSVKVLDFGLAKALDSAAGSGHPPSPGFGGTGPGLTNSPTLSVMATGAGMILGTAAYMSPEQAKGQPVDHRSDIFSFGCVLFEMITGRAAFVGDSASEILASVIKSEPEWSLLPANPDPRLRALLNRCLEKSRRQRWQAIGDVRLELESIRNGPAPSWIAPAEIASTLQAPLWRRLLVLVTVALAGAAVASTLFLTRPPESSPPPMRFAVPLPENATLTGLPARRQVAISPDGTEIAFIANDRLNVRRLGELESRPITDETASINSPVYSPDGRWIAFVAGLNLELKRVARSGGVATRMASIGRNPFDLSWSSKGVLYTSDQGIMLVNEEGGSPQLVAKADAGETFGSVSEIPGGSLLVASVRGLESGGNPTSAFDRAQVLAITADGQRRVLLEAGSGARYVGSGHVVFVRQGVIYSVPFDAKQLRITGGSVPVVEGVTRGQAVGQFGVSSTGTLVYIPGSTAGAGGPWQLAIFNGGLGAEPLKIAPGPYVQPRVSPDGKTVALSTENDKESSIWLYDLTGNTALRRLTLGAPARFPVWSPDSLRVAYQRQGDNDSGIFWQRADGSDTPEQLTTSAPGIAHIPHSWSRDGDHLLFDESSGGRVTLNLLSLKDRKATTLPETESTITTWASFSPDGRWITFALRRTGSRSTVFVQPYPPTGARYQISETGTEDGHHPVWSRDGRTLTYNPGPGRPLKVAQVRTAPSFSLGAVRDLAATFLQQAPSAPRPFDVLPDGRFVGFQIPGSNTQAPHIVVVLNWLEELKQKVPAAR